ncbi:FliC/FljB family flagellin [Pantoea alhagi]|uniref:FliC/FljB family flagellin n=1 Tax=Pantoea alhagi TaxID=1891675 RepID=UPI00202B3152|nr:FliC/FljB family flagellin [Pantoea alhagi]URQ60862.1 FliC/FljB family flagellin [Pantoea alhagi]
MSQVINTNALSLMAQNNLNKSQSSLGSAIQRLSSGLRINSAKDDAAGQAISNRFTSNITGLTQASRNANDGISLAQTTEGALNEINDNLQNIRRLTVQASNGTNSESDRQSIQDEITERLSEIDRISEQTDFNGVKVLKTDQSLTIQVGANDSETITLNLKQINADTLSMADFDVNKYADRVELGTKAKAGTTITTGADATLKSHTLTDADLKTASEKAFGTGGKGELYVDEKGTMRAVGTKADGTEVSMEMTVNITENAGVTSATFATGAAFKDPSAKMMETVDAALKQVDSLRSSLGAAQNRFASVISNLDSAVNNLSESRSRILDADFASEVSNMSRANILQSAGTTVLAQANQVPQNVLSLLR